MALATGVAVQHEGVHFNVGLGFVKHEGDLLIVLELAQAHTGAEILQETFSASHASSMLKISQSSML